MNWHPVTICECGMLMFMLDADDGKSLLLLTLILSHNLMRMLNVAATFCADSRGNVDGEAVPAKVC